MTRKITLLIALFLSFSMTTSFAQDNLKLTAKAQDKWEFGVHVGHMFTAGDIDFKPGFGGGIHLRKATDHLFSIRIDGQYGISKGDTEARRPDGITEHTTNWGTATLQGVITFNNFKTGAGASDNFMRKTNVYVLLGAGGNYYKTEVVQNGQTVDGFYSGPDDKKLKAVGEAGAGIAFRVSKKMNIGIEHKIQGVFGKRADYVDGIALAGSRNTSFRDFMNYSSVRFNFNLGKDEKSEPLYWVSPLDMIADDLAEVKARPKLDLTDSDGDGIIDMLDQEKNSPSDAPVDTRGVTLDSDGDGVADYQDKEPYSAPGYKVDDLGVAQIPKPNYVDEDGVNRIFDERFNQVKGSLGPSSVEWFLPMVNFANNSYHIRTSEYGKLHNVATAMKQHPGIRVVAIGHTDKTAGNCSNDKLSYNRAQATIDYLTNKYGIPRERFILIWKGENENLVPTNGRSLMNRRVEFSVASVETEMGPPECAGGTGGVGGANYSGNKEAGY